MTRRILVTLAILAGLAAAPGAQTFRWQAGGEERLRIRIDDRVAEQLDRVWESLERSAERLSRSLERSLDRQMRALERDAARIQRRVEARVRSEVQRSVHRHAGHGDWAFDSLQSLSDDPCRDSDRGDRDDYRHCEVREEQLPAGPLTVDARQNGGIRVEGWDRNDILVRAVVTATARDEARAKQLASGVQVQAGGGRVTAVGPDSDRNNEWWSVNYRISVPHRTDLELNAHNGGITIANVAGNIRFDTTNGGVRLTDLAGLVRGETRNGGLNVALAGTTWDGEGLDVETSNGGVTLSIPENYNAQLETRTVNGGFRFDYPLTLTGELSPRRGISTQIGAGGPPVRVRTTNGGLRIQRR